MPVSGDPAHATADLLQDATLRSDCAFRFSSCLKSIFDRVVNAPSYVALSTAARRHMTGLAWVLVMFGSVGPVTTVSAQSALDRIVAVVDNDVIMATELASTVAEMRREFRSNSRPVPDQEELVATTLDNMINERVLLHEAERRGIVIDEREIDAAVAQVADRNKIDIKRLGQLLEQDGQSIDAYRASLRNRLMVQRLVDREINRQVTVSDDELQMTMEQQKLEGSDEAGIEYQLARILIKAPKDIEQLELQMLQGKAELVRDRLTSGEDFSNIAQEFSTGPEAKSGGSLGWRKASELPTLYLQALSSMSAGQLSEVIRGPNGLHILKLEQTRGGRSAVIDEYHLRQILIRAGSVLNAEEVRNRLTAIRERIVQGEDFGTLARAHSEDARSQSSDGDMGWITTAGMPATIARAITNLKVGELSPLIQTEFGFHLFELLETRQQDASELVEIDAARRKLVQRKSEELYSRWAQELRARAYVEVRLVQE